ncbi:hypothetical protein [Paraburkholderia hospita]|jgi:hypothetical protein|uniref:hypothetical protein n=1 Tax=Paraburkholderia hospita TaxID=169430 RepID=UPI0012603378|nr:hypothetical protein [Paraburkholderia hospita]
MKKFAVFLLAAALTAPAVHASDIAIMSNRDNGLIVLTDVVGSCTSGRRIYVTGAGGNVLGGGCYTIDDPWVYVRYDDESQIRQYPSANFSLTPAGRAYVSRNTNSAGTL